MGECADDHLSLPWPLRLIVVANETVLSFELSFRGWVCDGQSRR